MKRWNVHSKGTTALETFSAILPSFFYTFIVCLINSAFLKTSKGTFHVERFMLEFTLIVVPIILNVTVLAPYLNQIVTSLFFITTSLVIILVKKSKSELQNHSKKKPDDARAPFITLSRSTINLISVIGILAVDFDVFPRRFAKTAKYGYSLMDVGVGLFVFSNGIVAPELRGYKNSFAKTLKSIIPFICLGGGRFFLTTKADYHVPVSEYGVHWNFFITLAVTKAFSSLVLSIIPVKHAVFSGISLLLAHEIFLQMGLAKYVLGNANRRTFVDANREGIVSSLGYVGLYFLSVAFGRFLAFKSNDLKSKWRHWIKMVVISCFLIWATLILEKNFGVSRRLANTGYCIWIMFIGVFMTTLFYLAVCLLTYIFEGFVKLPLVFEAINTNGLIFFLMGNILTGLINMNFAELRMDHVAGLVILILYMFVNCSAVCVLFVKNIKMKIK